MNFSDSEEMGRHFNERGFQNTDTLGQADAVLVNTCTVRDLAEHKASSYLGRLKDWKAEHPEKLIVVTGCAAERAKKEFKHRFPFIDLIVGAKDIERFPQELDDLLKKFTTEERGLFPKELETSSSKTIRYVTIMRGCNYNCTYCIVPSVRGREIYIPVNKIINDVENRVAEGAKEIWLLGQTVNSYKPQDPPHAGFDFADLLREVNRVPGVERIRFMSPHPFYLTPKLILAMAECEKVCEHMHLPVQSGSDAVLKKMRRNYTRKSYLEGVRDLRKAIPGISITTDLIVGFPGETEKDFKETLSLVNEVGFDSAYCFKYSPRPGTKSATDYPDDVSKEVKEDRLARLLEMSELLGKNRAQEMVGTTQEVLVEEDKGDGVVRGSTRNAWKIKIRSAHLKPGHVIHAKVTDHHSRELHGNLI